MWVTLKRLLLGCGLIALAGGLLLVSDLGWRNPQAGGRHAHKKWKIGIIEYVNVVDVEESEKGFEDGLPANGLVRGRDYEITVRNAQGDMGTLNSVVDAALTEGADMLVPFSSPSLQATLRKAGAVPVVFTYVADAIAAGAGKSNEDHLPNVTGVTTPGAYAEVLGYLRECLPSAIRVGTIFVPAEVNTVFHKTQLSRLTDQAGMELVAVAANSSSELSDAALALCSMKIDALCQVGGNLTATGFVSIAHAANRAKLPVFAFLTNQAREGAVLVVGRDYYDGGKQTAEIAARIIRGESPAAIPFEPLQKSKLIVNMQAARSLGLHIPADILKRADEVIGN
jgi:ABC-type uncharacterized transport system substrate-binding protein